MRNDDCAEIVHVYPVDDTYLHDTENAGVCWCGAWAKAVEGGIIIHHLNLTERLSLHKRKATNERR